MEIADKDGIEAVTMRRLGEKLGVLFGPNRVSGKNPFIEVSRRDRYRVEVCRTAHLQRVEAIERRIADGKAAPQPGHD